MRYDAELTAKTASRIPALAWSRHGLGEVRAVIVGAPQAPNPLRLRAVALESRARHPRTIFTVKAVRGSHIRDLTRPAPERTPGRHIPISKP